MKKTKNTLGKTVIEVSNDTRAIVNKNLITKEISVQINQLDPLGKGDPYKYDTVYLKAEDIIELAEELKKGGF